MPRGTLSSRLRGHARAARKLLWRRIDDIVHDCDLVTYRPPRAVVSIPARVTEPDEPLLALAAVDPRFEPTARTFLDCGFRTMIFWEGETPVGYVWWHDNRVAQPHPSVERFGIRLGDRDAYLFNLFVAPEHRAGRAAGAFFATFLRELRRRGFERAHGFVAYRNRPARWMFEVHGWKTVSRFRGFVLADTLLVSSRGLMLSSKLLALLDPRRRAIVREYVPAGRKTQAAPVSA